MPFIIVETMEDNDDTPLLSIVPHSWVSKHVDANGWSQLRWPVTKRFALLQKLQRDLNSMPAKNWTLQYCKIKRFDFSCFDAALAELNEMEGKLETEDENSVPLPKQKPTKPLARSKNLFNTMWEYPENNSSLSQHNINNLQPLSPNNVVTYVESEQVVENNTSFVSNNSDEGAEIPEVINEGAETPQVISDSTNQCFSLSNQDVTTDFSLNFISEDKLNNVFKRLDNITENQNKIITQLSKQQTILDAMMSNSSKAVILKPSESMTYCLPKPFTLVKELDDLEIKLENEDNFQNFLNIYQHLLNSEGKCSGKTGCYKLVDKIFDRKLLTYYSWSGGSRDKQIKHPFKRYENIIRAFFTIVKKVDSCFSIESCISFFQTIIRNAMRRTDNNSSKGRVVINRASSGRQRLPKPSQQSIYKNKNAEKSDNVQNEIYSNNSNIDDDSHHTESGGDGLKTGETQ